MRLPKIYPITDENLSGISHLEQTRILISAGARFIQLRDKFSTSNKFYESALQTISAAKSTGTKIIINDRVDIALALNAGGVHLGQNDLPAKEARKLLGEKAIIGLSTHSAEQAVEASELPIDYIAIGPVFATATKKNPDETVGIEGVKDVRDAIGDLPLVAIGGISIENFAGVLEAGADSVALISELVSDADRIGETYKNFATAALR